MTEAAHAATHAAYEYKSFDHHSKIRLLQVLPGDGSRDIHCILSETDTHARYEALSYCWGSDPAKSRPSIILETDDGPRSLSITPNLHLALQHLQLPHSSRHLWIDAVCINQHDNTEKSVQVPRMSQIYRNATSVCVWLGKEDDSDAQIAISVIDRLVNSLALGSSEPVTITQPEASAFTSFIDRPWFSRRWVVQEVALARHATIFCGRREVEWTKLAAAISLLQDRYQNKGIQSHEPGVVGWHRSYASFMTGAPATRLVDATTTMVCKRDDGTVWPLYTLETVVAVLASFECALPQDVLFSVVSLCADPGKDLLVEHADDTRRRSDVDGVQEEEGGLRVDYSYDFPKVARDFITLVLSASKRVDVLCRPWAPNLPSLPSWIAPSSGRAWERAGPRKYARANADPLVGIANRKYAASGNLGAVGWRFIEHGSTINPAYASLCVRGCVVDVVVKLAASAAAAGVIPVHEWAAMAGWTDFDTLPPVSFWSTLVADRGLGGGPCPTYYSYACQVLFKRCTSGTLNLEELLDSGLPSSVAEFIRRLECVVWNKKLAITSDGKTALVPQTTCEGDLICIPYGSSVPVVLHNLEGAPLETAIQDGIDCILRGDCYMHGIMYGEAMVKTFQPKRESVEFRLH